MPGATYTPVISMSVEHILQGGNVEHKKQAEKYGMPDYPKIRKKNIFLDEPSTKENFNSCCEC